MEIKRKLKAQVKTKFYYLFWGTATLSVFAGQIYVGSGYRQMSSSLDAWFDKTISIMIQKRLGQPRGYYQPLPTEPQGQYPRDGVIRWILSTS